ncbi:hypothetical protein LWI29_031993 [Acer saccharum]|uniref:Uncharacterized protein n=1 Tax=Acer saccharum TaxID=4024 RepID=A0AA39W7G1_ACESA|nr:hypothetical protein LWI29_031993 [Acer saccharum]
MLNLAENNLDGSIPSFLSNLNELTCLALGYNLFKPSPLPSSFENLSKLEILFVANASLVGEIPNSIGKLVSLPILDLSTNYLSSKIPYTIAELKSIMQIELSDNQLSEYAYSLKVNEKSDVYSFSVVLMELITSKRPNDTCFGENKDIVKWVTESALSSPERKTTENASSCCRDLRKLVDPRMQLSTGDYEEIDKVLDVAVLCTTSFPINRPFMRRVVELLKVKIHKLALPN